MTSPSNHATASRFHDIPPRPRAPIVLRWFGCEAELIGVNSDHFSVGDDIRADYALPKVVRKASPVLLRFSRGSEGWRLSPADGLSVYVNQKRSVGLTPLRSGDVVRLDAGGPGLQFTIVHHGAEPLANLATRYAPQLLAGGSSPRPSSESSQSSPANRSATHDSPTPQETERDSASGDASARPGSGVWSMSPVKWVALAAGLIAVAALLALFLTPNGLRGASPEESAPFVSPPDSEAVSGPLGSTADGSGDAADVERREAPNNTKRTTP